MRSIRGRLALLVAGLTVLSGVLLASPATATDVRSARAATTTAALATWHHWGNFVDPNRCHELGRQFVGMGLAQTYKCQRYPAPPFVMYGLWLWF
ncbi:hypothetical protein [Nonomuraea sp. NPDC049709]|uniref:hypothetical protein n=1 Tax=Nonomuraea sp. NPDC049709 TaxID=3154736 RepID=UPI00343849E8